MIHPSSVPAPQQALIIAAGGFGTRVGGEVAKQFIRVNNKPIIVYTLEAFLSFYSDFQVIISASESGIVELNNLKSEFPILKECVLVLGGKERYHSVKNALSFIHKNAKTVSIHDAARPLVSKSCIERAINSAINTGSGVCAVPLKESIRRIAGENSFAENRNDFRIIQTPQTFLTHSIQEAYTIIPYSTDLTDDASVFEKAGFRVSLVDGEMQNIKITYPEDLLFFAHQINQKTR